MDNLTHSLAGAILGQMGLKRKTGLAMPTLIIAANIPDIDAVATLLGGHQHLALRRGITHGPIALVLLPILLWAIMLAYAKWRPNADRLPMRKGWLLALAYIGTFSHPALDWLNNYGIRLLEPFSSQWFYGDTLFIIDIWIWAALIAAVWISRRREKSGQGNWTRPAWVGFTAICAYILVNGLISGTAESQAMAQIRSGYDKTATMADPLVVASPVPIEFWRREILWRDATNYGFGAYQLGSGVTKLDTKGEPHNADIRITLSHVQMAEADGPDYIFWSRMPILTRDDKGHAIIQDQRFLVPRVGDRFTLKTKVKP